MLRLLLCLLLTLTAQAERRYIQQLAPGLRYTRIQRNGPWLIHILDLAPSFQAHLKPALATEVVPGVEPLLSLAQRHQALAAINGGYFVVYPNQGVPGDPAGLGLIGGELISESVGRRGCLILSPQVRIAPVQSSMTLQAEDGASRRLNGRNRALNRIRSGNGHDRTQLTHNEIVEYLPIFGPTTPAQGTLEAVLEDQRVVQLRPPGGPIPANGSVLVADALAASWLRRHAPPGTRLLTQWKLDQPAQELISGGPILLEDGKIRIQAQSEGFAWSPQFLNHFCSKRHPRTLVGITAQNHLLLVVVDGHNPRLSLGFSLRESAHLLQSLGCRQGLNLDGGGSSTMVIRGRVVNHPSDPSGPRSIGDALLVMP